MSIYALGIDIGKSVFHVYGVDRRGRGVLAKRLTRKKLLGFVADLPPCLVSMEACGGAHHLGRAFIHHGHEVKLISPQFVKPYVKSNKNDSRDAEAICEASLRPNMRFVPLKTVSQQDMQSVHRVRSLAVAHRTAVANQARGLLLEYGVVVAAGLGALRRRLPEILEDADNELIDDTRSLLAELREELVHLDERIHAFDRRIERMSGQDEVCQRLRTIPGVGAKSATALVAAVGDGSQFRNARELSAWLGLVPRQHSTGGKNRLLGISKRGDRYLRMLLILGAQSDLFRRTGRDDRRSRWATQVKERRGTNIAAVALANKNARIAWALIRHGENYRAAA